MRQVCLMGVSLVSLLIIPVANSSAQTHGLTSNDYAKAIHEAVQRRWEVDSYSKELAPSSMCSVRIIQMPGGEVLSVDVLPGCAFNQAGQRTIVDAVEQSSPLPYYGFESAFMREIRMVFRAASTEDRQAYASASAQTEQARKNSAESDRKWEATVGARRRHEEYVNRCSFHLLWEMPRIKLASATSVIVTIDKAGKVVAVTDARKEPVDGQLAAALRTTAPCEPIPTELVVGAGTMEIGPIIVGAPGS